MWHIPIQEQRERGRKRERERESFWNHAILLAVCSWMDWCRNKSEVFQSSGDWVVQSWHQVAGNWGAKLCAGSPDGELDSCPIKQVQELLSFQHCFDCENKPDHRHTVFSAITLAGGSDGERGVSVSFPITFPSQAALGARQHPGNGAEMTPFTQHY